MRRNLKPITLILWRKVVGIQFYDLPATTSGNLCHHTYHPKGKPFESGFFIDSLCDAAYDFQYPLINHIGNSHNNQVNGILFKKAIGEVFPIKVIVLDIEHPLTVSSFVIEPDDLFFRSLFVIG